MGNSTGQLNSSTNEKTEEEETDRKRPKRQASKYNTWTLDHNFNKESVFWKN